MATDKLKVEYLPLDDLRHFPGNAKLHGEDALIGSIERFTFADPVLLGTHPEASFILAGHGRCIALAKMRDAGSEPPKHIAVDGAGRWLVPVVKLSLPPGEAEAFVLAHNRIGEKGDPELGAWDEVMLTDVLRGLDDLDVDLGGLGWDPEEMADLLKPPDEQPPEPPPSEPPVDPAEVLQKKWQTAAGQIWQCGDHYLVCCDGADESLWGCMPEPTQLALTFTSPPYSKQRNYRLEEPFDWGKVVPAVMTNCALHGPKDQQILVNLGLVHQERRVIVYWQPLLDAMEKHGAPLFGWYVWDQGFGLPGNWNGRFGPSHEWVFHFNKESVIPSKWVDKQPENIKPRNAMKSTMRKADGTTVAFTNPGASAQPTKIPDSVIRIGRQVGSDGHPAQFSVSFASAIVLSFPGDVYDPFLGSGTTMIACERLNRRCRGIELSPAYVAVCLERYLLETGVEPSLIEE